MSAPKADAAQFSSVYSIRHHLKQQFLNLARDEREQSANTVSYLVLLLGFFLDKSIVLKYNVSWI